MTLMSKNIIDTVNHCVRGAGLTVLTGAFLAERPFQVLKIPTELPVFGPLVEHAGNITLGGAFAYAAMYATNQIEKQSGGISPLRRIVGATALALTLGAGFNAISDTQAGMDHVGKYIYRCEQADPTKNGSYCTVDTGDFVAGTVAAGVLAASMVPWGRREDEIEPSPSTGEPLGELPLF
jgi:hypothetical protein